MMRTLTIPVGSKVFLGAPAKPMPRERSDAIAELVASIKGVTEAHLPQCFAIGAMTGPAQVLAIVIDPRANEGEILSSIANGLSRILPSGEHLDVWPLRSGSAMHRDVQGTRCSIHLTERKRPWWKFW
jgi:hypothetical protein